MVDFFENVELAPADPILGIKQLFNDDPRKEKIDLSIGVYQNDTGKIPTLSVVEEAYKRLPYSALSGGYLPIEGANDYTSAVKKLLFGEESEAFKSERIVTIQSLGGTGAIKYGADFLNRYYPTSTVYISNPTWNNHRGVFERAGFKVESYPYYDPETKGLGFEAMRQKFKEMAPNSIVVMHTCCHNPTGVDLSFSQWQEIIDIIKDRSLIPFLDLAYQGFAEGLEEDVAPLRAFVDKGLQVFAASSFSKNFSLYRRRIGALSVVCKDKEQAKRVLTQLRTDVRTNNSNPPVDGAAIVSTVLNDNALRSTWEHEVSIMRNRIGSMRNKFLQALDKYGVGERFAHLAEQRGMFSFSGLTKDEVEKLRTEHGVYLIGNGRICLAAMNDNNVDKVASAIAKL